MCEILIDSTDEILKSQIKEALGSSFSNFELIWDNKPIFSIDRVKSGIIIEDISDSAKLSWIETIRNDRANGFNGKYILVGKINDTDKVAEALPYDVSCFLPKPVIRSKLISAVSLASIAVDNQINEAKSHTDLSNYAKTQILRKLLIGQDVSSINAKSFPLSKIGLGYDMYQVIIYENYISNEKEIPYSLHDILSISSTDDVEQIDDFGSEHGIVLVLKGHNAVERFKNFLSHYKNPLMQKGSPLDTLFVAYGQTVSSLTDLCVSYRQASSLILRRFFCAPGQHVLGFDNINIDAIDRHKIDNHEIDNFCHQIIDYLQSFNRRMLTNVLNSIHDYLYSVDADVTSIKFFISDLYLQVKENMSRIYSTMNIPFPSNTLIIANIYTSDYMYQISKFLSDQLEMIMNAIGNSSRESVFDDILYYIEHNHHTNIRLESIASIFGYNSAYLGKIFNKTLGESFNTYIDKIRISHAKDLLVEDKLKVYEIAEQVGYKNVDYFHKKFKKYVGVSPVEYKKYLETEQNAAS